MYKLTVQKRLEKGGFIDTYITENEDIVSGKLLDVLKHKYVYKSTCYGRMYRHNNYDGTEEYTVYFGESEKYRIKIVVPC